MHKASDPRSCVGGVAGVDKSPACVYLHPVNVRDGGGGGNAILTIQYNRIPIEGDDPGLWCQWPRMLLLLLLLFLSSV